MTDYFFRVYTRTIFFRIQCTSRTILLLFFFYIQKCTIVIIIQSKVKKMQFKKNKIFDQWYNSV